MAGEAVVGALRVVLGMDTAAFEDGTKKATSQLQNFGAQFNKILGVAAVTAAFTAIVTGLDKTINSMDELGKAAQKIGIPVEELSALKYAAGLADVSFEALSVGLEKLAKNMSAVAGGAKGPATDAFKALGISVTSSTGALRSTSDVMGDVADKFSNFKDSAAKTALAIALFGRSGADLIPFLNEGKKGIADASSEAAKFGLIVTNEAAKAAQDFNDNLKRLSAVMQGILVQVVSQLSGELLKLSESLVTIANNGVSVQSVGTVMAGVLRGVTFEAVVLTTTLNSLVGAFTFLGDIGKALASGDFSKIPGILTAYKDGAVAGAAGMVEATKALLGFNTAAEQTNPQLAAMAAGMKALTDNSKADAPILATKTALDHFIDSTKKSIAAQQAEFDTFGMAAGAREKEKFLLEALQVAKANDITISGKQRAAIDALAASLELMNQKLAGQQIVQELLTPWQLYAQQLNNIGVLLASNSISLDTYAKKSQLLALNMQLAYATAMQGIVTNVASAFKDLAAINKNYAGIAKAAAIGEAIVNTYVGATKALATVPPPFNYAAAAAVVAAGLASVAKIVATPFATGGSFKVGGAGGFDSQLVTLALTPGEMVDVHRPSQQGMGNEITLRGIRPRDLFTGDMLRGLFDALNQGQRDGYKLKFAD